MFFGEVTRAPYASFERGWVLLALISTKIRLPSLTSPSPIQRTTHSAAHPGACNCG